MSGCSGWQAVNPVCRAGQLLGHVARSAGNDIFGSIAAYFASAAQSATAWLWDQLNYATGVDLTASYIKSDLIATGAIAGVIAFGLFGIQVISAALRQDAGGLGRAARGLAIAFIGSVFAVAATQALLAAVDGLCSGVVHFALSTDLHGLGTKLISAEAMSSVGNPAGLLLISLVILAAVVVVWVALMIRKMLIIISAVFAPVAFSGATSDVSKSWVRRWIEFTVALVFSKLVLVIIFMIGLSVLNGAGQEPSGNKVTNSVTDLVIGALTLLLAGFAPWLAIKMVHFAGDTFHAVHSQAATASHGGRAAVAAPQKVAGAVGGGPARLTAVGATAGGGRAGIALSQGKANRGSSPNALRSASHGGASGAHRPPSGRSRPEGRSQAARTRSTRGDE